VPAEVNASRPRPTAHSARPIHSRVPTLTPNQRSANQARSSSPPEIVVSTSESGAIDSAATWSVHAANATMNPIVHHRERKSATALCRGRRSSTVGDAIAPRYLQSRPTFATRAQASASNMPSWTMSSLIDPYPTRA
jgi:hypothetical protein